MQQFVLLSVFSLKCFLMGWMIVIAKVKLLSCVKMYEKKQRVDFINGVIIL